MPLTAAQLGIGRRRWSVKPSTGAAVLTIGNAPVIVTGTLTTSVLAATNLLTSTRTTLFSSGATAGTVASLRTGQTEFWRGNAVGLGGFYYLTRFGLNTLQVGMRAFLGVVDVTTAPTNVDPTTNATPGKIGLAINANTGNWKLVNNVSGTAPTVLDLGANFPVNNTDLLEMLLFCAPNDSWVSYQVVNLSTGNRVNGLLTANIPAVATFLAAQVWITNNTTAAAAILAYSGIDVDTNY